MTKPSESQSASDPRQALFDLLEGAVDEGVFPGCVALVYRQGTLLYEEAHGVLAAHRIAPGWQQRVARDTRYDLASLTKIVCTTSLVALAVGEGGMRLEDPVPEPWCRACPGATLTDLLEHCAGLRAHREYFAEVEPAELVELVDPQGVLQRIIETPPEYPLRDRSIYSDLGFIILGAWLERVFDQPLDVAFNNRIAFALGRLRDGTLAFRPFAVHPPPRVPEDGTIAPTEVYERELHPQGVPSHFELRSAVPVAHGHVHDDNAYVMGGVAGHAGLFGTAEAILDWARGWLELSLPGLTRALRDRFWTPSSVPGSTRRLGFDGPSPGGSGTGGHALSPRAVGHTGFTGTSVWIDPEPEGDGRIYVLLSNRVHPVRDNAAIRQFRPRFHEAAARL